MYIIIIIIIDISWLKLSAMAELVSMNTFFRCLVWSWLILIEDLAQALVWFCTCFWLQAWQKILFHTDMMCIKNFRALSDSAVNSVLLFSQKLLKLSFLKSICNEPSQDSSISWSCSWTVKLLGTISWAENGSLI